MGDPVKLSKSLFIAVWSQVLNCHSRAALRADSHTLGMYRARTQRSLKSLVFDSDSSSIPIFWSSPDCTRTFSIGRKNLADMSHKNCYTHDSWILQMWPMTDFALLAVLGFLWGIRKLKIKKMGHNVKNTE